MSSSFIRGIAVFGYLALAVPRALGAQDGSDSGRTPRSVTLAEAIDAALHHNPDLLIARFAVDSARSEHRVATALPNPTLSATPNTPYQYGVSIPIDFTPGRFYRARAASFGVKASENDREEAVRQTKLAVARAFFDILLAQEKRALALARRDVVQQVLVADSVRLRSGDVPFHNLVRSEVEMARADADVARVDVDVQTNRFVLQGLMGTALPDTGLSTNGSLEYRAFTIPSDSVTTFAAAQRPDVAAASQRVEQSRVVQHAASMLLVPIPVLSYVRQYTAPFESGHFYSLGLSFDLPILNLHAGERARAAAGVEIAELARRRAEVQLKREVAAAEAEFRIQRRLVERYQGGLLRRVDESVIAVRYSYTRGASSLLDVLDAVRAQQELRTDYVIALRDYWVSVHALNAAVGADVLGAGF